MAWTGTVWADTLRAMRSDKTSANASAAEGDAAGVPIEADVLVVGGGLVGMTLAIVLAEAGLEVAVVDRADPTAGLSDAHDGRASAIARGSQQALAAAGLWADMAPEAQPILQIRVSDGQLGRPASSLFLHYDREEVDGRPLGYMVENRVTRVALHKRARRQARLRAFAPAQLTSLERERLWVHAALEDGTQLRARLAVAADGRASPLRQAAGIRTLAWDYPQAGLVCTVGHALPHHGVAHECFLPAGPFAMLPLRDAVEAGGAVRHRSSIVWTERRALAEQLLALDDAAFAREMGRRFGDSLGALSVSGRRWSYPLSLTYATRTIDHRLALVGDAAHAIHPIAGQGFNLGLRDIAALAEVVVDAARLGLDPGEASVLRRYERWRRADNLALLAVTDGLNRLFSNDLPPLRLVRDLGLAAVDRMPMAKRFFMRHAMGLVGDLPRLIRGEAL